MDNYFDSINNRLTNRIEFNEEKELMNYLDSYAIILISFIFNDLFKEEKLNKLTVDNLKNICQLFLDRGNEIKNIFRFLHTYVSSYKFIRDNRQIIAVEDKQIFSFTQDKDLLNKLKIGEGEKLDEPLKKGMGPVYLH